jgi:hypothetical protein
MRIELVRRALLDVAGDQSPEKPHESIQALAMALLQVVEGIAEMRTTLDEMRVTLARLSTRAPPKSAKRSSGRRGRRAKRGRKPAK